MPAALDGPLPRVVWLLRGNAEEGERGTSRAANEFDPELPAALLLLLPGRGRTYPAPVPAPPRDARYEPLKRLVSEAGRYDRGVEEVAGAPLIPPRPAGGSAPTRDGLKGI